jgi:serine/threonine protein kinase
MKEWQLVVGDSYRLI